MSQLLYGSLNFSALKTALKTGKVKTFTTKSGVQLINVNVWINDQPDNYNNDASIQVQLKDEFKEEKSPYIGNLKKHVKKEPQTTDSASFVEDETDDLPF